MLWYILGITYRWAWSRPCTDRDEIEPANVFHAAIEWFTANFIQIGRHFGKSRPKKIVFRS